MPIEKIKDILAEAGLPVTYYQWPEEGVPELPYIVWYLPNSENFAADNKVYQRIERLNVELYARTRDFDAEEALEAVLDKYEIVWDKTSVFINSESMNQTLYEMDLLITKQAAEQED